MPTIGQESVAYSVLTGAHKGRRCFIRGRADGSKVIALVEMGPRETSRETSTERIERGALSELDEPGWPVDYRAFHGEPYGFDGHQRNRGNGTNMLRTKVLAQSQALQRGDFLATGEVVIRPLRAGYNHTPLIKLSLSGWVEVSARFAVALQGNQNFRLPGELIAGDKLVTGCLVSGMPTSPAVGWTTVYLDKVPFSIPSCIPLALN